MARSWFWPSDLERPRRPRCRRRAAQRRRAATAPGGNPGDEPAPAVRPDQRERRRPSAPEALTAARRRPGRRRPRARLAAEQDRRRRRRSSAAAISASLWAPPTTWTSTSGLSATSAAGGPRIEAPRARPAARRDPGRSSTASARERLQRPDGAAEPEVGERHGRDREQRAVDADGCRASPRRRRAPRRPGRLDGRGARRD